MVAQQSDTDRRRAIELLAGSAKQGCTEAFLLAGLRSNCWPRWSELASQLRRSSVRVLAAKPECISLTLAGGRSGISGRAVNGNHTRKESLKQAGARLRVMPPRKRYDRRQEPHHDLRPEV